ncbi:MAG: transmission trait enhancer LetE [Legionellaceae bacterium]|nr:transmission trait enhancer LetE [Legionellaceae bacterium]HAF87338.1 transmission trait enhancer LetE [Legionellales bacterium]HCA88734.1 transmission trait enhancer LetE [Legionellales bacterium]|tara:strand:+ start:1362 stop:1745 length:384 start_codon:yes stop_codon:yes gene_type:complete
MNDTTALLPHMKLKLNIDHPSLEESYVFGYECAQASMPEEENPFASQSAEHRAWTDGWWDGFYEVEPLFALSQLKSPEPQYTTNASLFHTMDGFIKAHPKFVERMLKIASGVAATAIVGYQLIDYVA